MHSSRARLVIPYGLKTLLDGASKAVLQTNPDDIPGFAALYFQELVAFREEDWNERLPQRLDTQDTSVPGEPKQKEKCTDTEEDQLLESPDTEYTSKMTQYPSTHNDFVENKSPTGPDEASSPKGPELAYVPTDPAQLATQMLGNTDSVHSVKDVATSVQTLPEVSLSSENIFAPVEGAAEDDPAIPAAEWSAEAVRAQLGVQRQSSEAGELGPSDSQAEVSTNDVNQVSSVPLQEEPSPPSPPPAPPPKAPLQAMPPHNEIEVTLTTEVVSVRQADELVTDAEVPPYIEHFPQKIIVLSLDQIAYLLKIERLLNAGQFSCAKILGPSADDVVCDPEKTESTAQMASAEQAMAASEAVQPPPYSNVWTLYCLTDLSQGQKSPPSLPPAGTGIPYPQATLSLSVGKDQQQFLQPMPLQGQPPQLFSPTYVIPEESKRGNVPPFILVGSTVQNTQDWKPIPGQAVLPQQDTGARRFTTIPVPVARLADQQAATPNPNPNAAQETARPPTPVFLSVAIPLDDVMSAKKGSPAGDKQTPMQPVAGSYSIAGQFTLTSGPIHRAGS
ncbi:calcium-binding tyrosine phosphorylation-regulated protein isoform X2 [Dromaius novaehollandiae]|uniref:calcium-binding tyrosine phosphorylation-regulated protein isoform X2 n=1 Tax=Dromaius novaehollandiae TaxID=8790 RepID=UPI00311E5D40